jgi:hydrophobe/amphiphile efflux-1 (HAE1) family protein
VISYYFIDRPVFAAVISIVIVLAGGIAFLTLPVDQYPYINPPAVKVSATFPGATAGTVAESVATPLEQELNGVPNMIYMDSKSTNSGRMSLVVTFDVGTNPDMAAVDVQNQAKLADGNLPIDVLTEGVSVEKEAAIELLKIALISDDPKYDGIYLSNYVSIYIATAIRRVPGVGRTRNTGARSYSMRIWLRPDRMAGYRLTTSDVINAIKEQNSEAAAGTLGGQPTSEEVKLTYPISAMGRLRTPAAFGDIVVRANPDGSMIRLRDVARVELGASAYTLFSKLDGSNATILQVYMLPGANALKVATEVKRVMGNLAKSFPQGVEWKIFYDASDFIRASINEVIGALFIALLLVVLVVYLFLQKIRTTLIPALAVPISLIGTFIAMAAFGFTINTVNLLALVLAIGIVVDDAIVVVENVERLMAEKGLSARDATRQAMSELTGALIATTLVLVAVFVPVSFLAGITGIMYREFAAVITVAVLISTLMALTLSPALCVLLLKPSNNRENSFFRTINSWLEKGSQRYSRLVHLTHRNARITYVVFFIILGCCGLLFKYIPSGFIPAEDQGRFFIDLELPAGASVIRSQAVIKRAESFLLVHPAIEHVFSLAGENKRSGSNEANGQIEVILKPWGERARGGYVVDEVMNEVHRYLDQFPEADSLVFKPPAIAGLGAGSGVELELQDRTGANWQGLVESAEELIYRAGLRPEIADAHNSLQPEIPQLYLKVDRARAKALGVPLDDIYSTMRAFTGSVTVNDFNLFGRVYRVKIQAEGEFREHPDSINYYYVRSNAGAMVPLNVLADLRFITGPASVTRYNMFSSASISAEPAAGYSTGDVIRAIYEITEEILPAGLDFEWTGITYQEIRAMGQTTFALGLALVFVFLFLAALYESWTIPVAVLMIAPIAMLGALLAVWMRGMENNLFFQIAFISLIGLAAKNSIMIVEFAKQLYESGMSPQDAALKAARLRFRPILMTAISFILGVMPLVLAGGPGSVSRQTLATAILGGMLLSTSVGIVQVPLFFVSMVRLSERFQRRSAAKETRIAISEGNNE